MDKQTLSNYGWVVIVTLILAVMLALATPFGEYVGDGVVNIANGFVGTSNAAIDEDNIKANNEKWDNKFDYSGLNNNSSNGLPQKGKNIEECTWEEIKAISNAGKGDEYFNLGDTKTITTTDGTTIVMEVVAFNADIKADGTGTAGITWISKDIVFRKNFNETGRGYGWEESYIRKWLQNTFYSKLPSELSNSIVKVTKVSNGPKRITDICEDSLWIPSMLEMFGEDRYDSEDTGATYTPYFNDNNSRIKSYDGINSTYYLRTAQQSGSYNTTTIKMIGQDGKEYNADSGGSTNGIVFGFCT